MMEVFKKNPFAMISALMCMVLFTAGVYGLAIGTEKAGDMIIVSFLFLGLTAFASFCING